MSAVAQSVNPTAVSDGWNSVREFAVGVLAPLLPTIVLIGLLGWIAFDIIRNIRDEGRLGWQQATILGGYLVVVITLLTVPSISWVSITVWAVVGVALLEVPKIYQQIRDDRRRYILSTTLIYGFFLAVLTYQLTAGSYVPSWWQFPGVLLGAIFSFAIIGDYSIYKGLFVRTNQAGEVIPLSRGRRPAA